MERPFASAFPVFGDVPAQAWAWHSTPPPNNPGYSLTTISKPRASIMW
jgi:hypothetical protein